MEKGLPDPCGGYAHRNTVEFWVFYSLAQPYFRRWICSLSETIFRYVSIKYIIEVLSGHFLD